MWICIHPVNGRQLSETNWKHRDFGTITEVEKRLKETSYQNTQSKLKDDMNTTSFVATQKWLALPSYKMGYQLAKHKLYHSHMQKLSAKWHHP